MLLRLLRLHNFKRYAGTSTIDTSVTDSRNIILIKGSNDRGKTTLLEAIKFALFGERQGMKTNGLINYQQAKLGDGSMYVEIVFEHNNHEYCLRRSVKFRQVVISGERPSSVPPKLNILEDGHETKLDQNWLDYILPMDVSQFFIFDGEQIQKYIDKSATSLSLKEPIEIILGIRELLNARADTKSIFAKLEDRRKKHSSTIARKEKKYNKLTEDLKGYEDERQLLKLSIRQAKRDINKHTEELNSHDELKNLNIQYKKLKNDIKNLEDARIAYEKKVSQHRGNFGLMLLRPLLYLVGGNESLVVKKWESDAARAALDTGFCVCGRALDNASIEVLNKISSSTRAHLHELISEVSSQDLDAMDELNDVMRDLNKNQNEIDLLHTKLRTIAKKIDSADNKFDHNYTVKKLREAQGDLERDEEKRQKCKENIINKNREIKKLNEEIESYAGSKTLTDIKRQQDVVIKLHNAVEQVIEDFYKKRKPRLEKMISDVFLRMTNNPELYDRIEIKDDFRIGIVRSNDMPTSLYLPSAGQSQVIATAIILGLSKFATRDAPIVIDTPLGRLDETHKQHVIEHYSQMGRQVIILYHGDEMNNQDIQIINNDIASEWNITSVPNQPGASVVSLARSNL